MPQGYLGPPRLKELLKSDKQLIGMWLISRDPVFVETAAYVGYDVLLIDMEHAAITVSDLERILIAIQGSPSIPIVRMPWNDQVTIKQVLDMGVEGMVVPMISSADEAKSLVSYSKYPPDGIRGIGPRRAQNLLANGDPWEYQRKANDEIVCLIPQIEHIDAISNIDAICSVPGVDGLFLGPSDLSLSMGLPGDYTHPDSLAARDKLWDASVRHELPLMVATYSMEDAANWMKRGARLVMSGMDLGHMAAGAKQTLETLQDVRGA
jgi:4-hydroxy-2-oxoheptanedioate aldolase